MVFLSMPFLGTVFWTDLWSVLVPGSRIQVPISDLAKYLPLDGLGSGKILRILTHPDPLNCNFFLF